jgi:hypothetical protein
MLQHFSTWYTNYQYECCSTSVHSVEGVGARVIKCVGARVLVQGLQEVLVQGSQHHRGVLRLI